MLKKINLIIPKSMAYALFCADLSVKESIKMMDKNLILNAAKTQKNIEQEIQNFLGKKLSSIDFFEIVDSVKENIKDYT